MFALKYGSNPGNTTALSILLWTYHVWSIEVRVHLVLGPRNMKQAFLIMIIVFVKAAPVEGGIGYLGVYQQHSVMEASPKARWCITFKNKKMYERLAFCLGCTLVLLFGLAAPGNSLGGFFFFFPITDETGLRLFFSRPTLHRHMFLERNSIQDNQ